MAWTHDYERLGEAEKVGRLCVECNHAATYVRTATHATTGAVDRQYRCTNHQARWCAEHKFAFPKGCNVEVR